MVLYFDHIRATSLMIVGIIGHTSDGKVFNKLYNNNHHHRYYKRFIACFEFPTGISATFSFLPVGAVVRY